MARRRRRTFEAAPFEMSGAFAFSLSSLVILLLAFFVFLMGKSEIDPMKRSRALESLDANFPGRRSTAALPEAGTVRAAQIEQVAKQAGFGVESEIDRFVVTLPELRSFDSGSDALRSEAIAPLKKIAEIAKALSLIVAIEGHTDNRPVRSQRFPSNWELSAARAVSVMRVFIESGVSTDHLSAAGRGEYVPVWSNEVPEGRAANRRVVLVIQTAERAQQGS